MTKCLVLLSLAFLIIAALAGRAAGFGAAGAPINGGFALVNGAAMLAGAACMLEAMQRRLDAAGR